MAWYRAGGGGIPAALKTGMNDVLNKKFGTSTTYAPNTWPDNVNLLGKLPEKTVSGAIAHIDDGADRVPVRSWQVTLGASLDGYSSVDVVQAGKNLLDVSTAQGTGTIWFHYDNGIKLKKGVAYTFSCGNYGTGSIAFYGTDHSTQIAYAYISASSAKVTYTPTEDVIVCPRIYQSGLTASGLVDVMLEVGSTASSYAPYVAPTTHTVSLGRTIYGGSVDVVAGTGTETYGLQTFDGTETWTLYETSFWYTSKPQANVKSVHPCVTSNGVKITYTTTGQIRCYISENAGVVDTSTNMNTLLSNGVSFNYQLNDNVDFTFTPITPTPETALGVNNFWADANSTSEVTYRRDIDLALGGG